MDFYVKHNGKYSELIITEGYPRIESGLLDDKEKKELALDLIRAAQELLENSQ